MVMIIIIIMIVIGILVIKCIIDLLSCGYFDFRKNIFCEKYVEFRLFFYGCIVV